MKYNTKKVKFKILPLEKQKHFIYKTLEAVAYIWDEFVPVEYERCKKEHHLMRLIESSTRLTILKDNNELLRMVNANVLYLEIAAATKLVNNRLEQRISEAEFLVNCQKARNSFRVSRNIKFDHPGFYIPKIGWMDTVREIDFDPELCVGAEIECSKNNVFRVYFRVKTNPAQKVNKETKIVASVTPVDNKIITTEESKYSFCIPDDNMPVPGPNKDNLRNIEDSIRELNEKQDRILNILEKLLEKEEKRDD